ncbi:hypothetical protein C9I98_16185 [Photobacterium sanctipauli]|uniref:Dinitrogenase iron-molybdenum cofactor biosynthesis domain-containing protein n=1 Tax=Photobacterium sanctipauli TaxID=1342794 RepID=A0A2T3NQU9_9GAMM|nr:NifB/NifX family molybdenum-iron cluster-binding protein [Photobacterium sanctipauli]PSW18602.1 hypothetical protein C9I98_16185 [Photobacterium sanctipauli]
MALAIAVTPRNEVAGHFGKAAGFHIYDEQGQLLAELNNSGSREIGCKHKKVIQRQLAEHGVTRLVLGNIGQRSLARLLNAGFEVFKAPSRIAASQVVAGGTQLEPLLSAEQGRPCKREKGGCGCGCGSKKKAAVPKVGTMLKATAPLSGLTKIGGLKL